MKDLRIAPAGDAALIVEWPASIDPETSNRAVALSRVARERLGNAVRDTVVGYCTVTLYFDPRLVDADWLARQVRMLARDLPDRVDSSGAAHVVPVCYGGEFGPDLEEVASFARCSTEEVVQMHAAVRYRVYVVGFVPGFPYMAAVNPRIAAPRRAVPRTRVPAGSVAIAAGQTGIYPSETPGGWHIIGRTWLKPYDPERSRPFLFHPGDSVTFRAVSRVEFDRRTS